MAPADVPEMPSICSQGSSRKRSSTPQVNAPCAPPPCSARSTSRDRRRGFRRSSLGWLASRPDVEYGRDGEVEASGPDCHPIEGDGSNQSGCAPRQIKEQVAKLLSVSPTMRFATIMRWQCSGSRSRHSRQTGRLCASAIASPRSSNASGSSIWARKMHSKLSRSPPRAASRLRFGVREGGERDFRSS